MEKRRKSEGKVIKEEVTKEEPKVEMERVVTEEPHVVTERRVVEEPKTVMQQKVSYRRRLTRQQVTEEVPVAMPCHTVTKKDVTNDAGEDLGKMEDLMVNIRNGTVLYAVVSFGGFLGIGTKLFAIPLQAFRYSEDSDKFILNVTKDQLDNAPGFDKDNWPTRAEESFLNNVYSHYGYEPGWQTGGYYEPEQTTGAYGTPSSTTGTTRGTTRR